MLFPRSFLSYLLSTLLLGAAALLGGCDDSSVDNIGQVSVTGDEGLLVGEGVMHVQGHRIAVRLGRVSVDERDYGRVSEGAEVYFRVNGDELKLLVNGEEQGPSKKP